MADMTIEQTAAAHKVILVEKEGATLDAIAAKLREASNAIAEVERMTAAMSSFGSTVSSPEAGMLFEILRSQLDDQRSSTYNLAQRFETAGYKLSQTSYRAALSLGVKEEQVEALKAELSA